MYVVHVIYRILPEKLEDFLDAVKKTLQPQLLVIMAVASSMFRWL